MCVMETMASARGISSELTLSRDPVFRGPPPSPGTSPLGGTYISRDHMPIRNSHLFRDSCLSKESPPSLDNSPFQRHPHLFRDPLILQVL